MRVRGAVSCEHSGVGESRDSDDFLGWAPDLGFWDAPPEAPENPSTAPAVVTVPPQSQPALVRRAAPTRPSPPRAAPAIRTSPRPAPRIRIAVFIGFAFALVATLFTALVMATQGPQTSPVTLAVWGVVTVLLGRFAWVLAHR